MSSKQAKLVAAIGDAMRAQGFSQNNLARTSGVSQSMISAALRGEYDLKEEKWRLLCETLALDYECIIAGPDPDPAPANKEPEPAIEEPNQIKGEPILQDLTPRPDNVNHPQHYELPGGLECFDVIVATQGVEAAKHFCLCNAMKYLFRSQRKNGDEDIEKARWYLNKYHDLKEG